MILRTFSEVDIPDGEPGLTLLLVEFDKDLVSQSAMEISVGLTFTINSLFIYIVSRSGDEDAEY